MNSWGRDLAPDIRTEFGELLRACDAVDGIERIRFTSPHPKDFRDPVIAAMAECDAVCEHIHLPLQSGSTRILKAMRRTYSRERYLALVGEAARRDSRPRARHRHHRRLPRRDRGRLRGDARRRRGGALRQRLHVHLLARAAAPTPRRWPTRCPRPSSTSGSSGSSRSSSASPPSATPSASAASSRSLVEGPSRTDPALLRGRTRRNTTVNFTGTAHARRARRRRDRGIDLDDAARPRRLRRARLNGRRWSPSSPSSARPRRARRAVAEALADRLGTEVVSCDALQVYRGLPILTNQPARPTALVGDPGPRRGDVGRRLRGARARRDRRARRPARSRGRRAAAQASTSAPHSPISRCRRRRSRGARAHRRRGRARPGRGARAALAPSTRAQRSVVHANDTRRLVRALELAEPGTSLVPDDDRLWASATAPSDAHRRARRPARRARAPDRRAHGRDVRARRRRGGAGGTRRRHLAHGREGTRAGGDRDPAGARGARADHRPHPPLRRLPAQVDAPHPRPRQRGRHDGPAGRSSRMRFSKWHALGNSYLVVEQPDAGPLTPPAFSASAPSGRDRLGRHHRGA